MNAIDLGDNDLQFKLTNTFGKYLFIISYLIFVVSAYVTITWWENCESIIAANTLGIIHPPGALISTILGWIVTKLPFGSDKVAHLNALAGITAAFACTLMAISAYYLFLRHRNQEKSDNAGSSHWPLEIGAAIGGLILATGHTVWFYATKFSPYIMTALFTALILWSMLRWWQESESHCNMKWLFTTALLFGLDFSVHRTNLLLLPGLFLWILLRNHRSFLSFKMWIWGIFGLVMGLSFHLLTIPIAARHPFLNSGDPSTFSRFWDYVSLKQYGGGWLINIFPRKGAFWAVQLKDYFDTFANNFFITNRGLAIFGILPALLGIWGIVGLWKRDCRMAFGLIVLFLLSSLGAVIYFNIPPYYFRTVDRHYFPSLIIFAFFITFGLISLIKWAFYGLGNRPWLKIITVLALILILPGLRFFSGYKSTDGSRNYFAYDFAKNVMKTLPPNSIIFSNGDNDTYPLWYLQTVENYRTDVAVLNLSLLNTTWFVEQAIRNYPSLPLKMSVDEISKLQIRPWAETSDVAVPVVGSPLQFGLPNSVSLPDSVYFHISPSQFGPFLLIQDILLLRIIEENNWINPIYFQPTISPENIRWIRPHLRNEGLALRLMPLESPPVDVDLLRINLFKKYEYRGYADSSVILEDFSRMIGINIYASFLDLASAENLLGHYDECGDLIKKIELKIPRSRLQPTPEDLNNALLQVCASDSI